MKKLLPCGWIIAVVAATPFMLLAQPTATNSGNVNANWSAKPFDHQIFIENKGQFNNTVPVGNTVLYSVMLGNVNAYFTPNGIIYRYDEKVTPEIIPYAAQPDYASEGADEPDVKNVVHYQAMNWVGANTNVHVIASSPRSDYYVYATGLNSSVKVKVYKKITYSNLYPGIDVEYTFNPPIAHQSGEHGCGIEYSLIVHPGADLSKVKISYQGAGLKVDNNGNLIISSPLGTFTEYNPTGGYQDAIESNAIAYGALNSYNTGFNLTGNGVGFIAKGANRAKTLVIDPWITNPNFTNKDNAFDCAFDKNGNVYAYGGDALWPSSGLLQLVKINSAGAIQWTFNASAVSANYYGDFCTDKNTGTSYICGGYSSGAVLKVNTAGTLLVTFPGSPGIVNELWRAEFDEAHGQIIFGAGSNSTIVQAARIDSNLTAITAYNVLGASIVTHDMALACIDPNGTCCYMEASRSLGGDPSHFNNYVVKLPLPGLTPTAYNVHVTGIYFLEVSLLNYYSPSTIPNGFNGAAASPNYLYMYDGDTVIKLNKATGAQVAHVVAGPGNKYITGGLDVDNCDNVYAGVGSSIKIYNSSLAPVGTIALSNSVYDLHLGAGSIVYACGVGFVQQTTTPASCLVLPVKLLSFDCSPNGNSIGLNWSTATQTNSDYFTVERAGEDTVFTPIATIKAAGNSNQADYYEYTDETPLQGINYYRLKETDLDGHSQTFNTTACSMAENLASIFPNPNSGNFMLSVPPSKNYQTIFILDLLGRNILTMQVQPAPTNRSIAITMPTNCSNGIYFANIVTDGVASAKRFALVRQKN